MLKVMTSYAISLLLLVSVSSPEKTTRPNIVLILTDDQDAALGGAEPLEKGRKLIADQGAEFMNAYATTPICCPSRASILTGRYLHNTEVRNNSVAGGCNDQKWRDGLEGKTFATHLKNAGYRTMYAGKYLNQYGREKEGGVEHVPPGWDWWAGLVGNSRYYNYTLSINGKKEEHGDNYTTDYLTDVIRRKSIQFLSYYVNRDTGTNPFLMVLAPPACHAPFTPAPQYKDMFKDKKAPRTPAFNRHQADDPKKHWLMETNPKVLSTENIEAVDEVFRNRWRTLLSVDDLIEKVVHALKMYDLLDNTYILFTSDHGYHLGQFGMPLDKRLPYEFDIKVPFWIRGPNITAKQTEQIPVLSIDIAPTLLDLAGIPYSPVMDGLSFASLVVSNATEPNGTQPLVPVNITENAIPTDKNPKARVGLINSSSPIITNYTGIQGRHDFLVEYFGEGSEHTSSPDCKGELKDDLMNLAECSSKFQCKCQDSRNNTFSCLRSIGQEDSLFCQFQDDSSFQEMYSINQDPYQLTNIANLLKNETIQHYMKIMGMLKKCKGAECNNV